MYERSEDVHSANKYEKKVQHIHLKGRFKSTFLKKISNKGVPKEPAEQSQEKIPKIIDVSH